MYVVWLSPSGFTDTSDMSHNVRKPVFRVSDQKMAKGMKFRIWKVEGLYHLCSENKGADQLAVPAKLICAFVFAHAKSQFSHDMAHIPV